MIALIIEKRRLIMSTMATTEVEEKKPSEFYFACRSGNLIRVCELLNNLTLAELERIEPNRSTALHAACYFNHPEIVQQLLQRGVTRRTINSHQMTAYEEAAEYPKICELFLRPNNYNRFGGNNSFEIDNIKWIFIYANDSSFSLEPIPDLYHGKRLILRTFHYEKILEQLGDEMLRKEVIDHLFRRALEEKDCKYLIQAFSTETEFADRINSYLVQRHSRTKKNETYPSDVLMEFVDTIYYSTELYSRYGFIGKCYRSIRMQSDVDIAMYKVGKKIVSKTFISASKDRQYVKSLVVDHDRPARHIVTIVYDIRQQKTALDIESLSEFPNEKEVLIMMNRIFKVTEITANSDTDLTIELCESTSTKV